MIIIVAAYLPLLSLTSIEGLLFRPMALTLVYALIGALIFSLLVVPSLASFLFRGGYTEWENPVLGWFRVIYRRIITVLLNFRWAVAIVAATIVAWVCLQIVPKIGTEFLPYMDEGVTWIRANFPEGTSLETNSKYGGRIREIVRGFPDVKTIIIQSGRNDDGTDPFPPSRMEIELVPRPREEWTQFSTKAELIAAIGKQLRSEFPTTRFNFTQPIIDSVTEDTNGTSANLAVDISGQDFAVLLDLARKTINLIRQIPGAQDVAMEQEGPSPQLIIDPDRALCARNKVKVDDVNKLINTALGGTPVSTLFEDERQFDIAVKYGKEYANSPKKIGRLSVYNADGIPIPLSSVAKIEVSDGPTLIAREGSHRRITVRCDISGRDQGGFVKEAQELFAKEISLPEGYRVSWLGMFQNLERARQHFSVLVPVTMLLIYCLLVATLGSQKTVLVVFLAIPFAFIGGASALYFRGMNLNVSTGVGFASLFGVAMMDGIVMVRWITRLRIQGMALNDAVIEGTQQRLRPILMASTVAILGLLPASLATGVGSDVQRPLATVIVWGLFSAATLTLFIVPVLYRILSPALPPKVDEHTTE
jgi:cobalt-zinc-cadmium resistance protein CzcA